MLTAIAIGAFALLFLGIPMWMIFMVMAIAAMTWQGVSMDVVVQGLTGTINNLVLLSVPGFIFAGSVMGRGGMATRLINWISSFLGPVPGGMALTTVSAAELFGAISGSSAATVAALGNVLYGGLRRLGYDERFSLGLITSSGAIAIIIPPSITMILFSVMTNASVGKLFLAGFIPGIIVGICAAVYCVWYALRHKITEGRQWRLTEMLRTSREVIWTLGAPIIIFGGIYGGFATPTEASMLVSVYAVLVSVFIYRELTWRDVWAITRETAQLSAKLFIIVAAAGVFSWVLAAENVPQTMVGFIDGLDLQPWMVLLLHQCDPADRRHVHGPEFGGRPVRAAALADRAARRRRFDPFRHHLHGQPGGRHVLAAVRAQHLRQLQHLQGAVDAGGERPGAVLFHLPDRARLHHLHPQAVVVPAGAAVQVSRLPGAGRRSCMAAIAAARLTGGPLTPYHPRI